MLSTPQGFRYGLLAYAIVPLMSGLAAATAGAQAQSDPGRPHGALLLLLGGGGEVENGGIDDDLEASFGVAGAVMYPLHRHFALGGRLGFVSWQSEGGDAFDADRSTHIDLAIVPAATFPVGKHVELYLALALGPSVNFFGPDELLGPAIEVDPALGFGVTPLFGARFWLGNSVGLIVELGVALHGYEHDFEVQPSAVVPLPLPGAGGNFDLDVSQPNLDVGVFFDF